MSNDSTGDYFCLLRRIFVLNSRTSSQDNIFFSSGEFCFVDVSQAVLTAPETTQVIIVLW